MRAVYDRTMEEAKAGLIHGPLTRAQIARQVAINNTRGVRQLSHLGMCAQVESRVLERILIGDNDPSM
eukprot:1435702-Prymnesium_polylepis.1